MKKLICLLSALLLLMGFSGCGTNTEAAPTTETVGADTVDYTPYLCPWTAEDLAAARSDGKMHYFFMAGEGYHISPNSQYLDKWGDSTLIVLPDGKLILVDVAPSIYGPILLKNLQQMGVEHLDYMLITHPHSDHQNGAFDANNKDGGILDLIGVDQVYWRGAGVLGTEKDMMVGNVCAEKNIPCQTIAQGDILQFGDVTMTVLWPRPDDSKYYIPALEINDKSITFRLDFKEHSALFPADLYEAGESMLLQATDSALLDADFLKVPHHGWATSSSDVFLKAVSPELSVAMGRVPITSSLRNRYRVIGTTLVYDLVNGYIHVTADADGTMEYTNTRSNDPDKQSDLNVPNPSQANES